MEYRLLKDGVGIITTREPELINDDLHITFMGAPKGATAIFERDDNVSAYRFLVDGKCKLDGEFIYGVIRVVVAVLDSTSASKKWNCDSIRVKRFTNGITVVYHDEIDMREKIIKLQEDNSDLKETAKLLTEKYTELDTKLNKLLEGYDIV